MTHLLLDTERNAIRITRLAQGGEPQEPQEHRFKRRWETLFLATLVRAARSGRSVDNTFWQDVLARHGQSVPLNRAQTLRLLQNLEAFVASLPQPSVKLGHALRARSVGPWYITLDRATLIDIVGDDHRDGEAEPGGCPGLVLDDDVDTLHRLLSRLLVADGFASMGKLDQAIDTLDDPSLSAGLTAYGQALIKLRLSTWCKRRGRVERARQLLLELAADDAFRDTASKAQVRFLLDRLEYDHNGATAWLRLWHSTEAVPTYGASSQAGRQSEHADRLLLAEWHVLRALLCRRHLLAAQGDDPTPSQLHRWALQHTQCAAYHFAWMGLWDRLQSAVANWSYHLQVVFEQMPEQGIQVRQVLQWHRLTLAYEDKLYAGRDSAWEYIFFAQFWLDNQAHVHQADAVDPLAHTVDDHDPSEPAFYEAALARVRECADERQLIIALTQYLRFAREHLPKARGRPLQKLLGEEIGSVLAQTTDPLLRTKLEGEGYARHWTEGDGG